VDRNRCVSGIVAGLLSGPVALLIAYLVGVVLSAYNTRELLPTLLVAATMLPLMLLFVLTLPTMMISILSGVGIALSYAFTRKAILIGPVVGLILSQIVLTVLLPYVIVSHPGDFTSIITKPFVSACHGLLIGGITGAFFQLFIKWNTPH